MKRILLIVAVLAVAAPLAAVPDPNADQLQANRRRFEQLRKHPEVLAKLRDDAEAYFKLSRERRQQIMQIQKELHQETAAAQTRLDNVLDRYAEWLEHLEKTDKDWHKKVEEAHDKNERLALIKRLREQQWIKDQPKAVREKIAQLQGVERKTFIAKEKVDERQRKLEWTIASRFWNELQSGRPLPTKLGELSQPVKYYVDNYLVRMFLAQEEKDQFAKLEGQWPQFPMKLVELADKHPAALPGGLGPRSVAELPPDVVKELLNKAPKKIFAKEAPANQPAAIAKALKIAETKWPEFGVSLAKAAKLNNIIFRYEFLAYNAECLSPPMQDFVKNKLKPALDGKESLQLAEAIGKWPDYPQAIKDLAASHRLHVPWFILPRDTNWDNYRLQSTSHLDSFPEVVRGSLRDVALFELDARRFTYNRRAE